jgi:hypothetical protein
MYTNQKVPDTGILPSWCPGSDGGTSRRPSGQDHYLAPVLDPSLYLSQGVQEVAGPEASNKESYRDHCCSNLLGKELLNVHQYAYTKFVPGKSCLRFENSEPNCVESITVDMPPKQEFPF